MKININDKYKLTNRELTDEGFLIVKDNKLARSGILEYLPEELGLPNNGQGMVKIFRDPVDLFDEKVLKSFKSKIVTLQHPTKFVDSKNLENRVGWSKDDIRQEGDFILGSIVIDSQEGIDAIENGTAEISLGYEADVIAMDGVYNGERYTHIFKDIKGNHIAIVDRGRNGSMCKISDKKTKEGKSMKKIIHDGVEFEASEQVAQVFDKLTAERDTYKARISDMEEKVSDMEEKLEDAEEKKKEAEEAKAKMEDSMVSVDKIDELVIQRAKACDTASKIIDGFESKGKSIEDIKKEVVIAKNIDITDKSAEFVSTCFYMIDRDMKNTVKTVLTDSASNQDQQEINDGLTDSERARQKMIDKNANAYKGSK